MQLTNILHEWAWLIGAISFIILYLINWYRRPNKFPPGPRGIPLFGYFPFIGKNLPKTAYDLSKQYGPIMSIRLGGMDQVFLNDFDSVQKALVKNGKVLSGRMSTPLLNEVFEGEGIVSMNYGNEFKIQRKFGLLTLRGFGVGKKGMEKICQEELSYLNEAIQSHDKVFDISELLHHANSNNLCSIVFGKRFDYDDEKFKMMLHVITKSFDDPCISVTILIVSLSPMMKYVPPFSFAYKKLCKLFKKFKAWLSEIVEEHEKTFDENNIRDFIDAFILEQKKDKDSFFTTEQLLKYLTDLFVGGTETASSALYWSILCFLHYPETQNKLRKEVNDVIGTSGNISVSSKAEMSYTNAFIQEVYRFRTLLPLSLPHKANKDTEINEYIIRKNTLIHANLWAVHNDPKVWENPETFNPERFLDENGKFIQLNHVIPFSVGPRHCLGEQLAQMEVFIFLVGMVQKFEFLPDPSADKLPTITDGSLSAVFVPKPYSVYAKRI